MNRLAFIGPLVVVGLLIAVFAIGLRLNPSEIPSPLIDQLAPAFSLPDLHTPDRLVTQQALQGQVTILNVWASWCVPCRLEHPLLMELADTGSTPIIGLNYKDDPATARAWLRRHGDPYAVTAVDAAGDVGIDWGVYGVPETFVIDATGRIRYKHIGPLDRAALETELQPTIARLQQESG